MRLRTTPDGLIAHPAERDRWVRVDYDGDLLAFLAETPQARAAALTFWPTRRTRKGRR